MKKRLQCHNGHSLDDPANLILRVTKAGKETRECRTCANERFKRMRQSKKAKGSKTKEGTVNEAKKQKPTEVDPMDFLEATPTSPALDEIDQDFANEADTTALIDAAAQPSAADLDAVAEEQEIAEKTANPEWAGIPGTPGDPLLPLGAPIPPTADCFVCKGVGFVRGAEEKLSPCPRCNPGGEVMLEDEGIMPVKAQVISQPEPAKPRRGCEHGYPNPMICPACKANGRR